MMSNANIREVLLAQCLQDAAPDLELSAYVLATGLNGLGFPTTLQLEEDWARLTLDVGDRAVQFGLKKPEAPGLSKDGLSLRVGFSLGFGVPSGKAVKEEPECFVYLPSSFTVGELLDLAGGETTPAQYMALENFSARHALSAPLAKFPNAALVMIGTRASLMERGDWHFELWTQNGVCVSFHQLTPTINPHVAAVEAQELGYSPTIYRCLSGRFICFKPTDGGIFI